jgi:hypothetical protein
MLALMTATAWSQGIKNALICGIGVLVSWCFIAFAVWQIFGQPLLDSFGVAFAVLWGLVFVVFLGTWLHGRTTAGQVLLDCGPHPTRWLFLTNAILFLVMGVLGGFSAASVSKVFGIAGPVFGVSFAAYWLVMTTGRLQVRENGIWAYWGLLRWGKIGSYRWADDSTLVLRSKGMLSLMQGALPVPPEHRQGVDDLLAKHRTAQATAEPGAAADGGGK